MTIELLILIFAVLNIVLALPRTIAQWPDTKAQLKRWAKKRRKQRKD